MGIINGFKHLFIGEDEIEEEEYAAYKPQPKPPRAPSYEEVNGLETAAAQPAPAAEPEPVEQPAPRQQAVTRQQAAAAARQAAAEQRAAQLSARSRNNKRERDVQMSTTSQSSFDLVLARPNNYRDVNAIGDDLNAGKTVILNLEMVKQEDATRILDFLSGVAYANYDEIKMMAQKTYAIMPSNVNFSGVDLVSELENNGYNF